METGRAAVVTPASPPPFPLPPGTRVALVHDWLTGMRGGEKVLEEIARRFPGAPIHTLFHLPGSVSPLLEHRSIHTSFLQDLPGLARHYRRYLPLFPAAVASLDLEPYDVVISTSHCVAKAVRVRPDAHHLCYCHTPMRYAWDQREVYFPPGRGPLPLLRGWVLDALRDWDARSNDRVDRFVANSSFVRDRIRRYYHRDADVVPPPVDVDFFDLMPAVEVSVEEPPFALSVAGLAPYKRLDRAVAACRAAGIELRVVGRAAGAADTGVTKSGVRQLGRVPREELRRLYRSAVCFVQPGIEDFGITVVEALACGCPVAAVGAGGVLDIVVDGVHGVLSDPAEGAGGLAAAIDKVRRMDSNKLDLRRRAEEFSTPVFHARMDSLLHEFLAPRSALS